MTDVTGQQAAMPEAPHTVAVVLAAGFASRFDAPTNKLDAELDGRPVLAWALDAVRAARRRAPQSLTTIAVVTGGQLRQSLPDDVVELCNPDPGRGLHSSLQLAVEHARSTGAGQIVVALGDQPGITPAAWIAVAEAGRASPIATAEYGGRRGHPVALAASIWPLLDGAGDEGAAALMRQRPDLVRAVPCNGTPADIDTLEDLQQWHNS